MNILGISAFYHESACCLLQDGRLVAAAAEERFSRLKHDRRLPAAAFRYCLRAGGLSHPGEIDAIAYYEVPVKKTARQLWSGSHLRRPGMIDRIDPGHPEARIRGGLGIDGPILVFDHHESHAASAYYYSGFQEAAILTADGVGEWDTTTFGYAQGDGLRILRRVAFPHSLGLFYAAATAYLGFRVNSGEYRVMGLAAHGRPAYIKQVRSLVEVGPDGDYRLDLEHFDFVRGERMYSAALPRLLGHPARTPGDPIEPVHADIAASFQAVLEAVLLNLSRRLHDQTGAANLCMAGGVALNAVANGRIRRAGPFREIFIQPAAGDAGGCLGAAALAHLELTGARPVIRTEKRTDPRPGAGSRAGAHAGDEAHSPPGEGARPGRGSRAASGPQTPGASHPCAGGRAADGGHPATAAPAGGGAQAGGGTSGGAGGQERTGALEHVYLGPGTDPAGIERLLAVTGVRAADYRRRTGELLADAADLLANGLLVGWFQGRMEFGPRALGNRSILADPRDPTAQDRINRRIKRREDFRPFAPSVLAEDAAGHFEIETAQPFMIETCRVRSPLDLPAVTHVDGSARPQTVREAENPRFAGLLRAFRDRTGCPILLNTSFNIQGQPIVCTPAEALRTMAAAGLDALALGDFLVRRSDLPEGFAAANPVESLIPPGADTGGTLYTFV